LWGIISINALVGGKDHRLVNFFDKLRRLSQREGDAASAFIQKQCPQTIPPLMQESHNHPPRRQHPSAVLFHPLFDISRKSSIIK